MKLLSVKLLALLCVTAPWAQAQTHLTILSTNDIDRFDAVGGLSGVVAAERAAREHVLFLHAGDSYSPSVLAGFDQGKHMVELLNQVAPDFMVLGNHEFDFGPEALVSNLAETTFPMLVSNVFTETGAKVPHTQATALIDIAGFQIGLMGLTSEDAKVKSSVGAYRIANVMKAAARHSAALRDQGADLVIALVHLSQAEDFALVNSGLADIVVSGDDHSQLTFWNGNTVLVESGSQAEVVTAIDLILSRDDDGQFHWSPSFRLLNSADYEPTSQVATTIAALTASLSDELTEVIGVTETELNTTATIIRGREAAFGNLLTDAMRTAMDTDVALANGGGIRADRVYAPGQAVTAGDILAELPFGDRTVVLSLTGEQLLAALENGFSAVEDSAGRFPHLSGMALVVDLGAEPLNRVVSATVGGTLLDPNATYTVATNDYMASGGDGYTVLREAEVLIDAKASALTAIQLIDHIRTANTIAPKIEGRIVYQK